MVIAIAVLASLAFIGWFIYRVVRGGRQLKAHTIAYGVACMTGIFTLAFFLNMDIPQLIKIVVSILLGIVLIVGGAYLQRHRQASR